RTKGFGMSWLSNVRNALSGIVPGAAKAQTADHLWHKCKGCGTMVFTKELEENLYVCPTCDHHERIGPAERFEHLLDPASLAVLPTPRSTEDPLRFRDSKRYADRLKTARAATGEQDARVNARGTS